MGERAQVVSISAGFNIKATASRKTLCLQALLTNKPATLGKLKGCFNLGLLHKDGDGVARDAAVAAALYKQACDGGMSDACEALKQLR